jgi:intein/homing endonuclease
MSNGDIKNIPDIKVGDELSSPLGSVRVLDRKTEIKECISIELDNGVIIEGTLDHKVWTHRGWVELQHLTEDDEVICEA